MNKPHLKVVSPIESRETERQSNIKGVIETAQRPVVQLVQEFHDRSALIIPTYENSDRRDSIRDVLYGLGQQPGIDKIDTYIADNGISIETREVIEQTAKKVGISLKGIINARPSSRQEQNPAFARNRAVNHIVNRGYDNPDERIDSFIFGDDDAVFSPDALPVLLKTHRSANDIAAVVPEIVPVKSLKHHLFAAAQTARKNGRQGHQMPQLWTPEGELEIMKIVGFSSDVTTKSCGLLVDAETIRRVRDANGADLFVRMPRNSGEDMILGATLSRLGRVIRNDEAKIYDKVRDNPIDTRKQRAAWGEDHVYMAHDFTELGYLNTPGLKFMQADNTTGTWLEFNLPNYDHSLFVINPEQIEEVLGIVKQRYSQEGSTTFFNNYGVEVDQTKFEQAVQKLEEILHQLNGGNIARKTLIKRKYHDIPAMDLEHQRNPRFSEDALTGLLVGNLVANAKINPEQPIFYGLRQPLVKD